MLLPFDRPKQTVLIWAGYSALGHLDDDEEDYGDVLAEERRTSAGSVAACQCDGKDSSPRFRPCTLRCTWTTSMTDENQWHDDKIPRFIE